MKKLLIGLMCLLTVTFTAVGLMGCKVQRIESTSTSESTVEESQSVATGSETCTHELTQLKQDGEFHWYECECGEQAGNREAHDYDDGVVTKQPTEEEEGEKLLTCEVCGFTATTSVPKLTHTHALVKITGTPATCEDEGVLDSWKCDGCQKIFLDAQATQEVLSNEALVIPAINHSNEAFSHRVAPRCGIAGADVYVCPDCERQREVPIDPLEHDWNQIEVVEATCEHGGYELQKCRHCQSEQKVNETGITDCDEEYVIVANSDCDNTGLAKYKCNDCGAEREIILPKCEHSYSAVQTVAPTCTEEGYTLYECSTCESSYKDDLVDSLGGHDFVIDAQNSTEPTCLENGLTVYVCSRGCQSARFSEEVDALGHDEVAPTCTEEGYCTRCDDVRIAKIPHSMGLVEDVAPTCTEDGHLKYACENCSHEEIEIPQSHKATGHNENAITWTEEEIAVTGETCKYYVKKSGTCPDCSSLIVREGEVYESHSYVCAITSPATCVAEGVKTYTCVCGNSYTEDYEADPSAHKLDAGVQEGNYLVYSCLNGDCDHSERVLHIVDEAVDANVVKDAEKLSVGDATLKLDEQTKGQLGEDSSVSLSAGTLEGADLESAKGQLNEDQLALLGESKIYNFEMEVDGSPVTQFNGYITIRIPYELDGQDPEDIVVWYIQGDTPVLIEARYIEIDGEGYAEFETNHFSYYSVAKMSPAERCARYGCYTEGSVTVLPATCLEGGYTLTVCRRCGKKTYSDRVEALGHNWDEVDALHVDTTCTVAGYEKYECTRCQVSYEVKTQAYGHEWVKNDDRTVVASCEHEGSVTFECVRCDNEYSVTERKTAHRYSTAVVGATCTEAGYTECVCRDCGYTTTKNPTPALGHNVIDTVHAPTCIDRGYTSHACSRCDAVFANTDYQDKTDHEWDRDEPTCEEDKLCKHCKKRDENNGKAHGHYMEDGSCKHCKKPCNHNFKYSHTVESTCSGAGYEVWVCKHCQANEFRGETGGPASHDFALLREVAPTCQSAGYSVEVCRACGYVQTTETLPAVDHSYSNGKCIYCGIEHEIEAGYIDVINTVKNVNGIVLKVDELNFKLFDIVEGEEEIEGIATALRAIEFMLYFDEDGNLQGAVIGAIQIYNGPVTNGYASYAFKGLIEGDNVYVLVNVEDGNSYDLSVKYDVQAMLDSIINEAVGSEGVEILVDSGLLDLVGDIAEGKSQFINKAVSQMVDVLFSVETVDGENVYTLDFDKVRQLNSDLAFLSAKDVLGKYFGEELLPEVKRLARQIATLELCEVAEFIAEKGLPASEIFNVLNTVAKMQGAPEDYDIRAMLESPDMAGYTVGDLIFGEDASFAEVMDMVEQLQESPIYLLLMGDADEDSVAEVYGQIDAMIGMFEGIGVSFTTDLYGVVNKFNVSVDDFTLNMGTNVNLSLDLEIAVNGAIDVTWDGIVGDIDSEIVLPEGLEDEQETFHGGYRDDFGTVSIDGTEYDYQAMIFFCEGAIYKYSQVQGATSQADCGDWLEYGLLVPYTRISIELAVYATFESGTNPGGFDDIQYFFVSGKDFDRRIPITVDVESGMFSAIGADGSVIEVVADEMLENNFDVYSLYIALFGELGPENTREYTTSTTVYYNKVTGEYSGESQHVYVLDEENSYSPAACEEQGLSYYVCTECGDVYRHYYTKHHNIQMKTTLSAGSLTCDDGVDMYYECTECGEITDYYEHWGTGCHIVHERIFENNVATESNRCDACGRGSSSKVFTLESDFALEFYTGSWGNHQAPGINGEIAMERIDGFIFKFVATEDVTAEFYSRESMSRFGDFYGYIYNSDFQMVAAEDDNLANGHFGITYDFVCGETYYLVIRSYDYRSYDYEVVFTEKTVETEDLSSYGCGCGGELIISSYYGRKEYTVNSNCGVADNETCSTCGFRYYSNLNHTVNDNCEEIEQSVIYFCNEQTGETFEYLVFEFGTGKTNHSLMGYISSETRESVDENGNPIVMEITTAVNTCTECGKHESKSVCVNCYDEEGFEVARTIEYYDWSDSHGDFVISSIEEYAYIKHLSQYGYISREIKSKRTFFNSDGEEERWVLVERVYYEDSPCKVTVIESDSKGYRSERTNYNHSSVEKELPDECYQEEVVLDGVTVTKRATAFETYCVRCHASLSKRVMISYVGESGMSVKNEIYRYVPYAESQDVYGWELEESRIETFGIAQYKHEYFMYKTGEEYKHYVKDSRGQEISYGYTYVYEYADPTSSCMVRVYRYDAFGTIERDYVEERHIAARTVLLLEDGATSCGEGLRQYAVCYICGMKEDNGRHWDIGHNTSQGWAHLDNVEVYSLADYGQVCDGSIEVVTCPCGQAKGVHFIDRGCDFDHTCRRIYDDDKYEYWYNEYRCAVSEPMCGFAYSYEYWYSRGDGCMRIYHEKWVFGLDSANQLVIECEYEMNDYLHDYEQVDYDGSEYVEEGLTVIYNGWERACTLCSHVDYKYECWSYYRDDDEQGLVEVKRKTLYSYYAEGNDRILSSTDYTEYGIITHPTEERSCLVELVSKNTSYSTDGEVTYWNQADYNYDGCIYAPVITYTNMSGDSNTYRDEHEHWDYTFDHYVITPTCTQSGIEHRVCDWCYEGRDYDHGHFGHDYYNTWDEELGQYVYVCNRCNLVNFTGNDGNVIMEDMTDASQGVFTVGYYFYSHFDYIIAVSLVLEAQGEPIVLNVDAYDDGRSVITVDFNAVRAACEEQGRTFEDVMVKVTILPTNGDYSFDYSVTMDSHQGA